MNAFELVPKGRAGYIRAERRHALIRTLIYLAIVLAIFFFGLIRRGTTQNGFSILAVVMCLPTGLSAVNLIMFLRSVPVSDAACRAIEEHRGGLLILYELMMTSENATYPIAAITAVNRTVYGLIERDGVKLHEAKHHIVNQLNLGGYTGCEVLLTKDLDEYLGFLTRAEAERTAAHLDPFKVEEQWEPGTKQTIPGIFKSISL